MPFLANLSIEQFQALKDEGSQQHGWLRFVQARQGINEIAFVVVQADLDDLVSQMGRVGVHTSVPLEIAMFGSGVRCGRGEIDDNHIRKIRNRTVLPFMRRRIRRARQAAIAKSGCTVPCLRGNRARGRVVLARAVHAVQEDAGWALRAHGLCGLLPLRRGAEDVGAQQFEKLASCRRKAGLVPLAHGGRLDLAQPRHLSGAAEGLDDLGIGMDVGHARIVGIPTIRVNRHPYSQND